MISALKHFVFYMFRNLNMVIQINPCGLFVFFFQNKALTCKQESMISKCIVLYDKSCIVDEMFLDCNQIPGKVAD